MSLIGKICVLLLVYMATGLVVTMIEYIKIFVKLYKIDPNNEDLSDELLEKACSLNPVTSDMRFKSKSYKEVNDQIDKKFGSTTVQRLLEFLIDWPRSLAIVMPIFEEAQRQIQDEYDRGIRIRKEKESS